MRNILPRAFRAVAVLGLLAGGACERNPIESDHAEVAAVRLTIGTAATVVTVNAAGQQTPTSVQLAQGTHAVVVAWLDAGGQVIDDVETDLTLSIAPVAGGGVVFTADGLYAGTLQLTASGQKTVSVRLMHGDHADFAQNVTFTVQ